VKKNDKFNFMLQMHHMTALLEAVDWDEKKQSELIEFVQESINLTISESFLKTIEIKYGLLAKNVVKNIITTESYYMKLHDAGGTDGN
jgi:hypothetical protein